jgi:hypothetical protein
VKLDTYAGEFLVNNSRPGELDHEAQTFSAEQIVPILKQAELGMAVGDIDPQFGISEQTFYRWKKQYGGMQPKACGRSRFCRTRTRD